MKKSCILVMIAAWVVGIAGCAWGDVAINEANFPDEAFRRYVMLYDDDGDGMLSDEQIANITDIRIDARQYRVYTLRGIEYFTALTSLTCNNNLLTELDMSKNTALTVLQCGNNRITELDMSNNKALIELYCENNALKSLNVSKNTALTKLRCYGNNDLASLDVSNNIALTELVCYGNLRDDGEFHGSLTELEVSNNTALTTLSCYNNRITALDVSKNTALTYLNCQGNQLTELDVSNNTALTYLNCNTNNLTALDVSKNPDLVELWCERNQLAALDVSDHTSLRELRCDNNQLSILNVSNNTSLWRLVCNNNHLPAIDVESNTALLGLYCESQSVSPLYLTSTGDSSYQLDFSYYMDAERFAQIANVQGKDAAGKDIQTTYARGIAQFASRPAKVTYDYATAFKPMDVTITGDTQQDKPSITTTDLPAAITGKSYSVTLQASGTTPITWSRKSGSLPKGLTLSDSGIISGTPTKAGKSSFTVKATNTDGTDTRKFTLQVCDPVSIITASLKAATVAKSYSITLKAKGTKPLTWSAAGLPNGLTLNANTGRISGKPAVYGTFSVKITASNEAGSLAKELLLTVNGIAPKLSGSLARAALNTQYSSGLKLTAGSLPVTWSYTGTLPAGLTFDTKTGTISGTPTSYAKSGYRLTITAMNDAGSKSKNVTLTVKGIAPKITVSTLPDATHKTAYTATLTATGSTPITWTADNLHSGLYIDGNTIKGTPSEYGSRKITLYATNPVKTVRKSITLNVKEQGGDVRLPRFSLPASYVIVAELGVISCDEPGMYEFDAELNEYAYEGAELVYMAGSDNPSDDDDIAEFYDESGGEISAVPESRRITVSIWLNPDTVYNPAIAITR